MGKPKQSLSQIGKLLKVSTERIRQIQNHTLEKLRAAAEDHHIGDLFLARI
jgi:DNA-directed RNA polymerase sigma subunit (sigma70/sigma32)